MLKLGKLNKCFRKQETGSIVSSLACPNAPDFWHKGADSKSPAKTTGGSHWFTNLCARPRAPPPPPLCSIESPDVTTLGATPTALWLVGEIES